MFSINNKIISDSQVVAEEFNNFFVSIGPQLASTISSSTTHMSYMNSVANSIFLPDITTVEVRNVILLMKNSSAGWDEIPAYVTKRCIDVYIEPLTHIIDKSFKEGIFPSELKLAKVVPIFKSGDSSKITNYRPISVLSFFSKVFEKVMYNHISNFIESVNVLYKYQFGFRQRHSTQQAIITLVNKITSSLDTGDLVIGVFLDLKKAFDTVDHKILLDKLHAYGIRGNIWTWFRSYLSNRSQFVSYDGIQSTIQSISCGVPQGSILGPLLFIIYINDICNVSELLFTVLYADDASVVIHGKDMSSIITILNHELYKLSTWLKANKLSLNTDKTYFIIFHRARIKLPDVESPIIMNNSLLSNIKTHKYLCVILDSKMSWTQHIAYVKNKVAKGIGIMFKARPYLDRRSLVNLYNAYIYPYLIYCVESWGNAPKCHLDQLYVLQKRIVRLMTFSNYNHSIHVSSEYIFRELKVLPLYNLVQNRIGFMMYKLVNGLLPDIMSDLCIVNNEVHNHFTRQSHFLHTRKGRNHVSIQCFNNTGPRIWNSLQKKVNILVPIDKFKTTSKLFFQEHILEFNYSS